MLRVVAAVIAGYLSMALVVVLWAFVAVIAIWPELRPVGGVPTYPPLDHPAFLVELPVNFVAAVVGGLVLSLVAGPKRGFALFWSGFLLVPLGLVDAMLKLEVKPLWGSLPAPFIGLAGLWAGSSLIRPDLSRLPWNTLFTRSLEIAAPASDIFAALIDPASVPRLIPAIKAYRKLDDGKVGLGTRFEETRMMGNREAKAVLHVSRFEQDRVYAIEASMLGLTASYVYTLEPAGNATHVRLECLTRSTNPVAWLFERLAAKGMLADAEHLAILSRIVTGKD